MANRYDAAVLRGARIQQSTTPDENIERRPRLEVSISGEDINCIIIIFRIAAPGFTRFHQNISLLFILPCRVSRFLCYYTGEVKGGQKKLPPIEIRRPNSAYTNREIPERGRLGTT